MTYPAMAALLRRNLRCGPITTLPLVAPKSNLNHPFNSLSSSSSTNTTTNTTTTTIEVETRRAFETHRCDNPPSRVVSTTSSELLSFFHQMSTMRRMEITADILYKSKVIRGFCHLYDGQEAIASGMEASKTTNDNVITAYRDHCIYLGRGGTLLGALAELMGRRDGCSKGKGGSMHFYKKDANYYGGHGIVGAQVPLGCGLAFAQKYNKENNVTFNLYGDGAANQGQLFEALNMSALWNLPVVLVCENNLFGMGTSSAKASKVPEFYTRGDYVPGIKVDGMDVLAVKQACKFAKEYVLENGPLILEMDCYRYHGHSMSDPGTTYRKRLEVDSIRKERDPISWVKQLILSHDFATEQELKDIEKAIKKEVEEAVTQAKKSPEAEPSDLFNNVYANGLGAEAFGADRKEIRVNLP